jgi:small-conductance mechanosensitive channel
MFHRITRATTLRPRVRLITPVLASRRLAAGPASDDRTEPKNDKKKVYGGRVTRMYLRMLDPAIEDPDMRRLFAQVLAGGTWGLLATTAMGTIGVDTKPLLAGLGATGFTLGFALKDAAANMIAGVSLVLQRPFKQGDIVAVGPGGNAKGTVEAVDYRYVHLHVDADPSIASALPHRLSIPASMVYDHPIKVVDTSSK